MSDVKFEESQQFRQKGLYVAYFILLALLALTTYAVVQQMILHKPFGDKPAPTGVWIILKMFLLAFLLLFYKLKLQTKVTNEGVFFRWRPFRKSYREFSWSDIEKAEIINYGSVGYGIRLTPYGTIHNVAGDKGLLLVLKSRKKFILGTQKPEELAEFLRQINKLS
jgi:hypothetical protein